MVMLALFSSMLDFTDTLTEHDTSYEDFRSQMNFTEDGSSTQYEITIPTTDERVSFSFFSPEGFLLLLIGLVAIGVASGISVLGSGFTQMSQSLIFQFGIYFSIWGILSAVAYLLLSNMDDYGAILWVILTLCYTIGFTSEMSIGGSAGE